MFSSGGAGGGRFTVLIEQNGDDGGSPALPQYDLFTLADAGRTTALNASPLSPFNSRARIFSPALAVNSPADGSYGEAFYDENGDVQLWDLPETVCTGGE
jgi:hypothetical protein